MPKGRKKRVIEHKTIGTQTSPYVPTIPQVTVTRLTVNEIEKYSSRCIPIKQAMQLSKIQVQSPPKSTKIDKKDSANVHSIIGGLHKEPSTIKSLPRTYKTFIKPITNNENANSTFDGSNEINKIGNTDKLSTRIITRKSRKITEETKQQEVIAVQEFVNEEVIISPARNCSVQNVSIRPDIESLSNNSDLNITPFEGFLSEEHISVCDQATQTYQDEETIFNNNIAITDNSEQELNTNDTEIVVVEEASNEQNKEIPNRPRRVRFELGSFATSIRSHPGDSSTLSTSDDEIEDTTENRNENNHKYKKYIRITANTVHIHNHFYKQ